MDGTAMQRRARERTAELPGAALSHPFGDAWDVWKVRDKVFMLQTTRGGDPIVTVKADPEDARALRAAYSDITAGHHMNKRHWITLHPGGSIDPELVSELVTESYLLVVAGLPRVRRPVDPVSFGRPATDPSLAGAGGVQHRGPDADRRG